MELDKGGTGLEEYVNVTTEGMQRSDSVDYEYMQPDDIAIVLQYMWTMYCDI